MSNFVIGQRYSRGYIAKELGGSIQSFLPTKGKSVVGCCYRPADDPQAPNRLTVGGKDRYRNAQWFADQGNAVPFFKKLTDGWEYIGDYRVRDWSKNPETIRDAMQKRYDPKIRIVLFLESVIESDYRIQSESGAAGRNGGAPRQPDPERRAQVEVAAVKLVLEHFVGFEITDRQLDCVGWDLEATKDGHTLYLEVKGVSGADLRVELTPNEYAKMRDHSAAYRVCVVTSALEQHRQLYILQYRPEKSDLIDEVGTVVQLREAIAARLFR